MPLTQTLVDLLQKSRESVSFGDGHMRRLDATTPDDRAAAVCAEIGETVLARKLTFVIGTDAVLVVDAGGRRLMRVVSVEPSSIARPGDAVFSMRDDSKLAEQTQALGRVIAAVCAADGNLMVASEAPDSQYVTGAVGFTPDKLYEAVAASAKSKPLVRPDAAPAPKAPAKFSPTEAMKAMIREKVEAATNAAAVVAVTNPGPIKAQPTLSLMRSGNMRDETLHAFYSEVQNTVSFCAILDREGNVEAVGGKDSDERILAFSAEIIADLERWLDMTAPVLSQPQIILLKSGGIQNQSVAYLAGQNGFAMVIFANTDLSRIFAVANKIVVAKSST